MATISVRVARVASALPRLRSVEAAKLLEHRMVFWGKDVLHAGGKLLVEFGCTAFRRDDAPHHVRCYALSTPQGRVILHSTGVLLQPDEAETGIAYLRPTHRLYHVPPQVMPRPCASDKAIAADLQPVKASEFPAALTRLLQFVRDYENRAAARLPARAREDAWREHRRTATHGIKWLAPADSRRWLDACLASAAGR